MQKDFQKIFRTVLFAFVGLIILTATHVNAAEQDLFQIYGIEVEGYIDGYVVSDIDNDSLTDLIVIYSPNNNRYTRYLGLYLQKEAAGFRPRADYLITLPNSVAQLNVGDIDGDNFDEIVLVDSEGISAIRYSETAGLSDPQRLVSTGTLYSSPYVRGIMVEPFIYDLTNHPGNELIVPTAGGYSIFQYVNNSLKRISQLAAPMAEHISTPNTKDFGSENSIRLQMTIPSLKVIDGNLDGLSDIYFIWNNRICCFYQRNENGFNENPDFINFTNSDINAGYSKSFMVDCNNDNRPDLITISTTGGISSTETKLRLYLADPLGVLPEKYTDEISLSDSYSNLLINDYNFDNIPEIVIPAVEMGTFAATKIFLTKKTDMHLLIYNIETNQISNEPNKRLRYEFRFDFADINPVGEVCFNWLGDYNADRLLDAVFCDGNGRLQFFWGHPTEYLSKSPDLEIPLNHPSRAIPVNLNDDSLTDLIVEHNMRGRFDRLSLLINNGSE